MLRCLISRDSGESTHGPLPFIKRQWEPTGSTSLPLVTVWTYLDPLLEIMVTDRANKLQSNQNVPHMTFNGVIISNKGSEPESLSRIAKTIAALSRLNVIWREKNISLASLVKLMQTLILSTFLYALESWNLTAETKRKSQALEMRCYRALLNIFYCCCLCYPGKNLGF